HYKIDYAKELVESGRAEDGQLGFYENGPFLDMCEGPHLEDTREIQKGSYSLDSIAGSYWRGDEKNPMLTRIYGLAFECADDLKDYKKRRELARQRDHKKLGTELELFMFDEIIGVGLPIWLPKGNVIKEELEKWACETEQLGGYQRVTTPVLTRGELYEISGHLEHYEEDMFPRMITEEGQEKKDSYYLRPMNCPHHHTVYGVRPRSYKELPLRLAEYGSTFRYEKHGSLSGLLRVRAMSMNDAHIYCEPGQVADEFKAVIDMYRMYYTHLRLGDFRVRLSLHDAESGKYEDKEEDWLRSEAIVREILDAEDVEYTEEIGEAAFYGPKIDIQVTNIIGREETVSTCQLDFIMADRFDLEYIDSDGEHKRPFIIHRAPLSTHERMISILIELYGGAFPTWMSPVQVKLIPVGEHVYEYCEEIKQILLKKLIRVEMDDGSDKFNKKIRKAVTSKVPNMWIIGGDEMDERKVTWRRYCKQEQVTVELDAAIAAVESMYKTRIMDNFEDVDLPLA
ncbi:MAG: threonine--tRNA ligase, partial [Lentisphaeria bacterium]|nr:threonine--tRNA ligase [Lentisphaeria bacterium]NQZ67744.1 threonine--tRNA ligase [Lentisphaeria bacterium]